MVLDCTPQTSLSTVLKGILFVIRRTLGQLMYKIKSDISLCQSSDSNYSEEASLCFGSYLSYIILSLLKKAPTHCVFTIFYNIPCFCETLTAMLPLRCGSWMSCPCNRISVRVTVMSSAFISTVFWLSKVASQHEQPELSMCAHSRSNVTIVISQHDVCFPL